MLAEGSSRLDSDMLGSLALVIDATESAWNHQDAILRMGLQLSQEIPQSVRGRLFFLGNPEEYRIDELKARAATWWAENSRRGSFIRPNLSTLGDSRVVVIGSGPIYDLQDFEGSEMARRLVLVNVGERPLCGFPAIGQELRQPNLAEVLRLACDAITSVSIIGTDFMPYYWDNEEYSLSIGETVSLEASPREPSVSVMFYGRDVHAILRRESGEQSVSLRSTAIAAVEDWRDLTEKEAAVFAASIAGRDFTCPVCGGTHSPPEIKCYDTCSILGESTYPSFGNKHGFAILRSAEDRVRFRFHPVNAIRLGEARVAITRGRNARICEYDSLHRKWLEREEMCQYYPLAGEFVLAV